MDISSRESTGSADTAPPLSLTEGRYGERGGGWCHLSHACHGRAYRGPTLFLEFNKL